MGRLADLASHPDFAQYAKFSGAAGVRVTSRDEREEALVTKIADDDPALIGVTANPELV